MMEQTIGQPRLKNTDGYYALNAAEQSSSAGFLIEDSFAFPDPNGPVKVSDPT